jgi:hypothetical protein
MKVPVESAVPEGSKRYVTIFYLCSFFSVKFRQGVVFIKYNKKKINFWRLFSVVFLKLFLLVELLLAHKFGFFWMD